MILGVLPLNISNKVNSLKHILKLNLFPSKGDPLKHLIDDQMKSGRYSPLTGKVKDVFNFYCGNLRYFLNTSLVRILKSLITMTWKTSPVYR